MIRSINLFIDIYKSTVNHANMAYSESIMKLFVDIIPIFTRSHDRFQTRYHVHYHEPERTGNEQTPPWS